LFVHKNKTNSNHSGCVTGNKAPKHAMLKSVQVFDLE
jgi:hypothetical protein